jgi:hypothetical protein
MGTNDNTVAHNVNPSLLRLVSHVGFGFETETVSATPWICVAE